MGQQPVTREEETNWSVGEQGLTIPLCFIAIHQHTAQRQGPLGRRLYSLGEAPLGLPLQLKDAGPGWVAILHGKNYGANDSPIWGSCSDLDISLLSRKPRPTVLSWVKTSALKPEDSDMNCSLIR